VVETPLVVLHPVLTVVFAKDRISISFGCDDSREYGHISRDRLAAGIPYSELSIFVPALISEVQKITHFGALVHYYFSYT